jgi:hypothetical protein
LPISLVSGKRSVGNGVTYAELKNQVTARYFYKNKNGFILFIRKGIFQLKCFEICYILHLGGFGLQLWHNFGGKF